MSSAIAPRRQLSLAITAVIACGFGLALLQRGLLVATSPNRGDFGVAVVYDAGLWLLWLGLSPFVVAAARRWPFHDHPIRSLVCHLLAATVLSVLHTAAFRSWLSAFGPGAARESFFQATAGMLTWRLAIDAFIYATLLAVTLALDAAARARAEAVAAMTAAGESTRARLHALQMQIQPHFLFNALNTAAMMARAGDTAGTADIITRLSGLLRELVTESPEARVPLREELAFVERYLAIERARFGDRLRVSIAVAPDALDIAVPRLLLQPLVENAVRHGLSRSPTSGAIAITAMLAPDGWLTIRVSDDGPGPASTGTEEGIGLGNTRERLATLYGDEFELALAGTGDGAVATVRLPVARPS